MSTTTLEAMHEKLKEMLKNASQRSDVAVRVPEGVLGVAVRVRISDYGIRVRLPGLFEN